MNPLDWIPLASKYANRYKTWGYPHHTFEDLLQTAMVGVVVACDKYDSERGYTFQACASLYIRKELQDLLFTDPNEKTLRIKERIQSEDWEEQVFIPDIVEQEVFLEQVVSSLTERDRKFLLDMIELTSADAGKNYMREHGITKQAMGQHRARLKQKVGELL